MTTYLIWWGVSVVVLIAIIALTVRIERHRRADLDDDDLLDPTSFVSESAAQHYVETLELRQRARRARE
jgi:hypothetical protein